MGELVVDGLARHFRSRRSTGLWGTIQTLRAVDGVSFRVAPGTTLGIVGESGCGKSTLARMILGLMVPTAGTVHFDGVPVGARIDQHWRARRRDMQMIYQDPIAALDRRYTAAQSIAEPLAIHEPAMPLPLRAARVAELMAQVGLLAHHGERYPHELSGGQRQRVVIARALILKPRLLVCDEPVSALDISVQAQVLTLFQDLQAANGFTAVFISHDLKVVRQIADQVAVMYLGRIVEIGPPEAVLHAPQHPYTRALVAAIPDPRRRRAARAVLTGDPPNPVEVPGGCRFHPRCPQAFGPCPHHDPALLTVSQADRAVACHLVHPPVSKEAVA